MVGAHRGRCIVRLAGARLPNHRIALMAKRRKAAKKAKKGGRR